MAKSIASQWILVCAFAWSFQVSSSWLSADKSSKSRNAAASDVHSRETLNLADRIWRLERRQAEFAVGTVVFCTSNSPPSDNWVPCDGKSAFPETAPEFLRGKSVPDLQGHLVAVGNWENDPVDGTLAAQTVHGNSFVLPAPVKTRIAPNVGNATNSVFKGGMVIGFQAEENYRHVPQGEAGWKCYGGEMDPYPAEYDTQPQGAKLDGEVTISPPPHAFLHAYVRIR